MQLGDLLAPQRRRAVAAREECQRRVPSQPAPEPRQAAVAHELVVGQADAPQLRHVLEQLPGQRRQVVVVHRPEGETASALQVEGILARLCVNNKTSGDVISGIYTHISMQTHTYPLTPSFTNINMEAVIITAKIHTQDDL